MAEIAVSFVLEQLYQLVIEEGTLLEGVQKDFTDIKDELESIQAFLKDADRRASDEESASEGMKTWVKQLREASFHIEDVIDEHTMCLTKRVNHTGCIASLQNIAQLIKTLKKRHQIATEIQDIKLSVRGIKERSERYNFQSSLEHGSSDPRMASLFIEETEAVGFESPRDELIGYLVEGTNEAHVDFCGRNGRTWKNHSYQACFLQSKDMVQKFCKETKEPLLEGLHKMDENTLITEVRQYLHSKRYLVLFDDVWKEDFSDEIEHAIPNNNRGSRIIITTRMMHVADFFKKSFPVHVHKLQHLSPNKALELFCKKAFRFETGGHCPTELKDMSNEIVQKCGGLPLAIVAIGGLLSTKAKTMFEWRKVSQNLRMEFERNAHLTSLTRILSLGYDDLPHNLKPCMLYFGIYPEGYSIKRKRLTRQWMAEGFVKYEEGRTLEDVAEEYLTELIHRSLVQVSKFGFDGKVKSFQVHDLLRQVIIRKMKDLSFCHLMHEDDELVTVGTTRRFSIAASSNNVLRSTSNSGIRSILCLTKVLPRSIGKLLNLETLDLRQTLVRLLPREINKLTKLRLLPVYYKRFDEYSSAVLNFTIGVRMQKLRKLGINNMRREYGTALCAAIEEMNQLECLNVSAIAEDEIIDLNFISSPSKIRWLYLKARLEKLPDWIPKLEYLVKLRLALSKLSVDPLKLVKNLPNLLRLSMWDNAYDGEVLHFQSGGFPKLKELDLSRLNRVSSILIDKGALLCLEHFKIDKIPQLKEVPSGIKPLDNLKVIDFVDMPAEFVESIDTENGQDYWIIKHVPLVFIRRWIGPKSRDYEVRTIRSSSKE
ncbi:Virus X resistance protein-like, coiled-coil domain [Sesbania bispinosa]|nr:Virus X resistance protein-like, coiled-coil domain [Sesbania bispinosa]